jgi:hypothetical protein
MTASSATSIRTTIETEDKGDGMTIINRYDILIIEPVMPGHDERPVE